MLKLTKKDKQTELEKEIISVILQMNKYHPSTKEYAAMANSLVILYEAKSKETFRGVSPDTLAVVAGNLLGIGLILHYEKINVITSKAVGFILRGRV